MQNLNIDDIHYQLISICRDTAKRCGVSPIHFNFENLIRKIQIRNAIIRQEYSNKYHYGNSIQVKEEIAKRYGLCRKSLEIILYGE
mgnify:CR=1 FL=1